MEIKLKNPVMVASGTFGYGKEFGEVTDLESIGAIVTKSISLKKREGNPPPRICETASGMLNTIGLQNDGLDAFIKESLPFLSKINTTIIANIAGETEDEFVELAKELSKHEKISAIELNISCPNVKKGGMLFGCSPVGAEEIIGRVRKATKLPLIAKLSPNVTDIVEIARAAKNAGADAVSLINTVLGLAVDVEKKDFKLSTKTGGLSGPAIKPIALRMVWQVAQKVDIPIIGIGGICSAEDALEFFMVGASYIQIGTGNFIDVNTASQVAKDLQKYDLKEYKNILVKK